MAEHCIHIAGVTGSNPVPSTPMKKAFDEQLYKRVSINNLILFVIYLIVLNDTKCSFRALVKKSFNLFPKTFALSGNSKWPDTRKLDRPLRTLRDKKLISGDPQTTFSLTKKGKKTALQIAKIFTQRKLL